MASPPKIFADRRRLGSRRRALAAHLRPAEAARFVLDDMVDETIERLAFLREQPGRALIVGDWSGRLAAHVRGSGATVIEADIVPRPDALALDLERPFPVEGFDLVACLGLLDTVNDLPGALIHIRNALAPGGLAIASFVGAGSLPVLRRLMLAAEAERPAARTHPLVDVRAGGQLLSRAGWADPVVDSQQIRVAYRSLGRLVADLREQGLGNVLAAPAPLTRATYRRAGLEFEAEKDADGRVVETFAVLTLTGRRR